jgi:hypothetical protein
MRSYSSRIGILIIVFLFRSAPNNNNIDRKIEEALVSQFLVTPDKQKHITVI